MAKDITISFVDAKNLKLPAYQDLLEPSFKTWILTDFSPEAHRVLAAFDKDQLVGLAVMDIFPMSPYSLIQSLYVSTAYRRQKLGITFVKLLEDETKRLGASQIRTSFHENLVVNKILSSRHWNTPTLTNIEYYFYMPSFNPTWLTQDHPLAQDYSLHLYEDLLPSEKKQMDDWGSLEDDDDLLITPTDSQLIKEKNFVIIKYKHEIAGWIETHRLNEETIVYNSHFLFKKHRSQKLSLPLLAESLRLHKLYSIPIAVFTKNLNMVAPFWVNFISSKLEPHAFHAINTYSSFKLLNML